MSIYKTGILFQVDEVVLWSQCDLYITILQILMQFAEDYPQPRFEKNSILKEIYRLDQGKFSRENSSARNWLSGRSYVRTLKA